MIFDGWKHSCFFQIAHPEAITLEDVVFFDSWKPPAYLVATANPAGLPIGVGHWLGGLRFVGTSFFFLQKP